MKKLVSIVVPVYNEEKNLTNFYNEINNIFKKLKEYNFELIYVADPSTDNTFGVIKELNMKYKNIKYILMANRFGKESSMLAGLKKAKGDYVCIMDVDMQDPPSLLPKMIGILENEDYDSVATRRVDRKGEPVLRSFLSNMFYKMIRKISKLDMKSGERDFRLMNRRMVDAVLLSKEKNRFLKAIYSYTGFKTKWLEFENIERFAGKTKWSNWQLYRYAITCIFGFSNFPVLIINFLGILLLLISIIMIITYAFLNKYLTTFYLILTVIMFFTGLNIFSMSILCEYLYRIFIEVKDKPSYVIMEEDK